MGDVINVWALVEHIKEMRAAEPESQLRYYATPSEYANKAWRAWFDKNYPTVILIEQRPILP